ncbi:MAG: glycoside hydrolase family 3 C-terminal domain-containing protein [Bacteroidota bacterium]|nr:glycoside hydrolase family 3 C-terminal domain-containing protein [Bacteroidota bacterium]
MKKICLLTICLVATFQLFAQKVPQLGKDKIEDVVAAMTPEEKVYLVVGLGDAIWRNPPTGEKTVIVAGAAGRTWGIPRLGITPSVLADGPAGLRINAKRPDVSQTFYCTAFPTATALASSWNTQLVENVGKAMGNEVLEYGCDVLLSPAINIHRNPLCGRNFEYYSEDPLIAGKMGAAMIRGIQSNGVGTSLKHFVANNIETNRMKINAVISQRTLREIYLRGFEIAVKEAQPWTVMSSYNRLNGFYTSENADLLTTILRNEWGFQGMVMSDWGGGADAVAQMNAGNDMIMPGSHQRAELLNALKNKTLHEKILDRNIIRILSFILKNPRFKGYAFSNQPDLKAHAEASRAAATEGMVLLKNDKNVLPFKKVKTVALFGKTSYRFIAGGTGSGEVNYEHAISIKEGFVNGGFTVVKPLEDVYTQFVDTVMANSKAKNKKSAVDFHAEMPLSQQQIDDQVKNSDIAIITIGRNAGEGWDRKEADYFVLSDIEKNMIKGVCGAFHAAGKKAVVVLNVGGVMATTDWRDLPDAIVLAWQTGQEGANALVDILKGKVNPSGKLPMSFPVAYQDVPSSKTFPGEPKDNPVNAFYDEGVYVGYRYYNTFKVPTAYEFGYGLSYTQFQYSDISLSNNVFSDSITVKVNLKNTGKAEGKEVVELYLSTPKTELEKPEEELKAFAKTKLLKPGESQELSLTINARALASFWSGLSAWVADKGEYEVRVGASSKDIRLKASFTLPNTVIVEKVHNVLYPNFPVKDLSIVKSESAK